MLQEWLISTPKHIALYNAFGWNPPEFAHAGLLVTAAGEKLSKRNHDVDVSIYRNKGFLPQALNNWLALLGWSMGAESGKGTEVVPDLNKLAEKV
jgi:glutamyl-tRNA synthetase